MLSHHPNYKPKEGCGCGSDKSRFDYVPDTIYGLSIKGACCPHDDRYERGGTELDKQSADREFLANMLMLIEERANRNTDTKGMKWYGKWFAKSKDFSYPTLLARRRALKYYEAVVSFGDSSFNFHDIEAINV